MASSTADAQPAWKPIEVSFPLPLTPSSNINLQLTHQQSHIRVFLTTTSSSSSSGASLGSFVYATPDLRNSTPRSALSTPLYVQGQTFDFAQRLAKALAVRLKKPVYVGNSMHLDMMGLGGSVEEQMMVLKRCVDVVMKLATESAESK